MKCLVLLSILLVVPAIYGFGTKTKSGPPPRRFRPRPPAPAPAPRQHPAILTQQRVIPPVVRRNDVKDVPDNFRAGAPLPPAPAPGFIPPAAPASRRLPPRPTYNVIPAAPPANVPPTRTRTLGMLRPLPVFYDPYVPAFPTPTTTQGWATYDVPDANKEEEESR